MADERPQTTETPRECAHRLAWKFAFDKSLKVNEIEDMILDAIVAYADMSKLVAAYGR